MEHTAPSFLPPPLFISSREWNDFCSDKGIPLLFQSLLLFFSLDSCIHHIPDIQKCHSISTYAAHSHEQPQKQSTNNSMAVQHASHGHAGKNQAYPSNTIHCFVFLLKSYPTKGATTNGSNNDAQ